MRSFSFFALFAAAAAAAAAVGAFAPPAQPHHLLSGPVGDDLRVRAVPRPVAYRRLREAHAEGVRRDRDRSDLEELGEARELLRDPRTVDWNVSVLLPADSDRGLFTILYRTNRRLPMCYTIEAVIRDRDGRTVTMVELDRVLNRMVRERSGHLQTHPLNSWARGRYAKELGAERRFCLPETLGVEAVTPPGSHSGGGL